MKKEEILKCLVDLTPEEIQEISEEALRSKDNQDVLKIMNAADADAKELKFLKKEFERLTSQKEFECLIPIKGSLCIDGKLIWENDDEAVFDNYGASILLDASCPRNAQKLLDEAGIDEVIDYDFIRSVPSINEQYKQFNVDIKSFLKKIKRLARRLKVTEETVRDQIGM